MECEYKECFEHEKCKPKFHTINNICLKRIAYKAGQESASIERLKESKDHIAKISKEYYGKLSKLQITLEDEDTDNPQLKLNGKLIAWIGKEPHDYWCVMCLVDSKNLSSINSKPEAVDRMLEHFGLKREDLR